MRKFWTICLTGACGLAMSSAFAAYAAETVPPYQVLETQFLETSETAQQAELQNYGGLTPRGSTSKAPKHAVILAQNATDGNPAPTPPPVAIAPQAVNNFTTASLLDNPVPASPPSLVPVQPAMPMMVAQAEPAVAAQIAPAHDPYIYSEIDRLSAELAKLKKDTAKPDVKKAWAAPKIQGRLFLDSYSIDEKNIGDFKNKTGIREMQITAVGTGYDVFDYKMEFALSPSGGEVNLVDNWIGVKNLPLLGYVKAGHFKPETGLAYPVSALNTTLTDSSGVSGTFGFGRRFGVAAEETFSDDRIRLFYGFFQDGAVNNDRFLLEDNQGQLFNVRLSAAPIFSQEGKHLFHIGGHWSYASTENGTTALSAAPGNFGWLDKSINTGTFGNEHHNRGGVELAMQRGPFAIQAEGFFDKFDAYGGITDDRTATGAYVELSYFLTGEHRTYDPKKGVFGAVKMKNNFHPVKVGNCNLIDGFGAWQAVVQFSYLDLGDWQKGQQNDFVLGMNWFWTPNIRWIFEYAHSEQNATGAEENIFGTSLRLNF